MTGGDYRGIVVMNMTGAFNSYSISNNAKNARLVPLSS